MSFLCLGGSGEKTAMNSSISVMKERAALPTPS
jgi:hypothetical protein